MIKKIVINPELYALTFTSIDSDKIEIIRDNLLDVSISKIKIITYNNSSALVVDKDLYENVIDQGIRIIRDDNLYDGVNWVTKNNVVVPCGYYHVASSKLKDDDFTSYDLAFDYLKDIKIETGCDVFYNFDRLLKQYNICLKNYDYDELVTRFNKYILDKGLGPFEEFNLVSRYGKYINNKNLVLCKEK